MNIELESVRRISGNGWYLRFIKGEGFMAFQFRDYKEFPKHIFQTGQWWKIIIIKRNNHANR